MSIGYISFLFFILFLNVLSKLKRLYKIPLGFTFKLKFQHVCSLKRAFARTLAARLDIRFCSCALACALLFMKRLLTYNMFSKSAWYFALFQPSLSLLQQFWLFFVFFVFSTQNLMSSKFFDFAHVQYQPCHEWFLHIRKNSSDFEQFWGFKCIWATNTRFFTHNKVTQDFNDFLVKIIKTYYILIFLKILSP